MNILRNSVSLKIHETNETQYSHTDTNINKETAQMNMFKDK